MIGDTSKTFILDDLKFVAKPKTEVLLRYKKIDIFVKLNQAQKKETSPSFQFQLMIKFFISMLVYTNVF